MLKTPEQYRESLRRMRPNVYKFDELIEDVTAHPATRRCIEGHAQIYEASLSKEHGDMLTKISPLSGVRISRYLSFLESAEDMIYNCRLKRLMFNLTGTCTGGRCAGWAALNAMWATTYDIDQENGTTYHSRLKKWLADAQERDITCAGALTDPKGDRSKSASQQEDKDSYLRVTEHRDGGLVVRGAKIMIAGAVAANEVFVIPGTGFRENEKEYAVSFACPRDAQGLTVVEARHPSDTRAHEDGFDDPVKCGGITQGYLFFEDVFIPGERVFMDGETKYCISTVMNFIAPYRSAIGGCVAGQGDVMMGAAALHARVNGLSEKLFTEKFIKMAINNETTFALGVAASALGKRHPSGLWVPDQLIANVNKAYVATLPYETKRIAQDICGGIAETGCMPSYKDLQSKKYGHLVKKYLKANSSAETRMKVARLVEWLTLGAGVPGTMHGGGSQDGAKIIIKQNLEIERKIGLAKRLAAIDEEVKVEDAKK
jgi:4-hydroxybutyryl-CoA dehydratase/vinylacetyl-CoA-Delta-isomerase